MGVAVHDRGSLADWERVDDFKDCVIELALAIGGIRAAIRETVARTAW